MRLRKPKGKPVQEVEPLQRTTSNMQQLAIFLRGISPNGRLKASEFLMALKTSTNPKLVALHDEDLCVIKRERGKRPELIQLLSDRKISISELSTCWTQYQTIKGKAEMMALLPQVMADTAQDACSRQDYCEKCDGKGVVADESLGNSEDGGEITVKLTRPCPKCKGKGEVLVPGQTAARKLVLEVADLIGNKGPLVAQQFNFNEGASLEDTLAASELILEG